MTSFEIDEETQNLIIISNFIQQNYNLEELKNITEKYVEFTGQKNYKDFTVNNKNIEYKYNDNDSTEIENWIQYSDFISALESRTSFANFIQKNKLDKTLWYKKVWVWLLIVLTILCVRYSIKKVKK